MKTAFDEFWTALVIEMQLRDGDAEDDDLDFAKAIAERAFWAGEDLGFDSARRQGAGFIS
jgi:hypothetical protein